MSDTAPQPSLSDAQPLRVCVLGCSGFIGSHLTRRLLDDGRHEIVGIDVLRGKAEDLIGRPNFDFRELDASDEGNLRPIVEECDAVVHLAAICNPSIYNKHPSMVIDASYTHVLPAVRLCRELGKRLIFFSTCEVYGKTPAAVSRSIPGDDAPYILNEDTSHLILGPVGKQRWTYACAKQLAERIIFAEGQENGLDFTIIRPFNFIGPKMDYLPGLEGEGIPRVFPIFMQALLQGTALPLVDGGRNRRTFIHIAEAVDACVRIIERAGTCRGEIFNIGNPDNECSIVELARLMARLYEEKTGIERSAFEDVSAGEFYGEGYDDCDRRVPDISKAARLLDWQPFTSLEEVFSSSMDYYVDAYGDGAR